MIQAVPRSNEFALCHDLLPDRPDAALSLSRDEAIAPLIQRVESSLGIPANALNRFVEGIKAGTVWVNTYRAVSFMAPFGGMKQSGLGRESGQETIMSYLQTKTVWIRTGEPQTGNPFVMR